MARLDKRMELRLDQLLQLLRRERGEFWVSSQQLWDSIDHANKQVSIEQEWFDVRVAEQPLLPELRFDNKQGVTFRSVDTCRMSKASKVF